MKKQLSLIIFGLSALTTLGQKPPIDHSIYDQWKNITYSDISPTGKLVYYTVSPQEGDSQTVLKTSNDKLINTISRAVQPRLNKSENHLIVTIKPSFTETREAKIKKKKASDMPKDSLGILSIGKKEQILNLGAVKNYKTAFYFDKYLTFTQETEIPKLTTKPDSTEKKVETKNQKKETALIVYNLNNGDTSLFWKVDNYYFSNDEKYLVFNKNAGDKDTSGIDGLYFYDIQNKKVKKISNGKGVYKNITFDDHSKQLVFLADKSSQKNQIKDFQLYYYSLELDTAKIIANSKTTNIPNNWYISGNASLNFNADGNRIFFGLAPIPKVKDTTLVDFEHAKLDIWHWKDDVLMTQQLVNLKKDQAKSYLASFDLANNKLTPLLNEKFNKFQLTNSGNEDWLLATSNFGHNLETQWQLYSPEDIYIISINTGEKKLIKKDWVGSAYLSPDAEHILLYNSEKAQWYSYHITSEIEVALTEGLDVAFANELNDMPIFPSSYGIAAWANDYKGIYLNDRFDIWYCSLDGKIKQNITNAYGRKNNITFRALNIKKNTLRPTTFTINQKEVIILTSFNEKNKENGFFSLNLAKKSNPIQIIQDKFTYKSIKSDDNQKIYLYTKENYQHSPNLYSSVQFKTETELTDINPQQKEYNWGTAELVHWTTPKGYAAEGVLYKPENFDPNKKYPIIAYFYETSTEGLYSYQAPAPTPSRLNIPYYVSNEYLVFSPDIRYELGYPGKSAEEYINSGMQYLARTYNWVDSTKMAIQGQSWGGYQVAHLITRTNMYAAAWTGAPVVNMTSAYGGIRWGTGMSRQFQYEKTQSRLGVTPWENLDLYIENSPLFFMDKVNTPVAIMHNDNDGAVPWYQGIEMFTALRRLQKPVWLLNYNGDDHNLMQRQNRKDIQIRQSQFFDHFLKGKQAAEWIEKGVPAIEKGINWGTNLKN